MLDFINKIEDSFNELKNKFTPINIKIDPALKNQLEKRGYSPEQIDFEFSPDNISKRVGFASKNRPALLSGENLEENGATVPSTNKTPQIGYQEQINDIFQNNEEIDQNTAQSTPESLKTPPWFNYFPKAVGETILESMGHEKLKPDEPFLQDQGLKENLINVAKEIPSATAKQVTDIAKNFGKSAYGFLATAPYDIASIATGTEAPETVKIPFTNESAPLFQKTYNDARKQGFSPLLATIITSSRVAGDILVIEGGANLLKGGLKKIGEIPVEKQKMTTLTRKDLMDITRGEEFAGKVEPDKLKAYQKMREEGIDFKKALGETGKIDIKTGEPKTLVEAVAEQAKKVAKDKRGFAKIPGREKTNEFKGLSDNTLKTVEKLKGKTTVKKQFISDLTRAKDLKQPEKDLINKVLKDMPDGKISIQEFADKVKTELLPLKRKELSADVQKYKHVSLPADLKGNVSNYSEHIYESPVETSAGNKHFNEKTDNYFAHTRIEDMADKKTRRVIEIQSDLFQKNGLEEETGQWAVLKGGESVNKISQKELDRRLALREKEVEALKPFKNNYQGRIVQEEMRQASKDGKEFVQFPTGETAMKIEGLSDNNWIFENADSLFNKLKVTDLKVGKKIRQGTGDYWIITNVLDDGKFKAVPKVNTFNSNMYDFKRMENKVIVDGEELRYPDGITEAFDISDNVNKTHGTYKTYEKDLQKYLKKNYPDMKKITDKQGVSWFEVPVTKEMANNPVGNYGEAQIGAMLKMFGIGAGLAGAGTIYNTTKKFLNRNNDKKDEDVKENKDEKKDKLDFSITPYIKMREMKADEVDRNGNPLDQKLQWGGEEKKLKDIDTSVIPKKYNKKNGRIYNVYSKEWVKLNKKQVEVANRIADVAKFFDRESWIPYLQAISYFESMLGERMVNVNKNKTVDNGYFMINNSSFPRIGKDISNDLDKSTIWAIGLIESGDGKKRKGQKKWRTNKYAHEHKIQWE